MSRGTRYGDRDRSLRILRDRHRTEYDEQYRAVVDVEGRAKDVIWKARRQALAKVRDNHRDEYDEIHRALRAVELAECRVCGAEFWNLLDSAHCGDEFCRVAWGRLRYLVDEEYRTRQRRANAKRRIKVDPDPVQVRASKRLLAGTSANHGRWLVKGSETHFIATECARFGLPIVDEFPDQVRARLEDELGVNA